MSSKKLTREFCVLTEEGNQDVFFTQAKSINDAIKQYIEAMREYEGIQFDELDVYAFETAHAKYHVQDDVSVEKVLS